jgi:hypothetical protein
MPEIAVCLLSFAFLQQKISLRTPVLQEVPQRYRENLGKTMLFSLGYALSFDEPPMCRASMPDLRESGSPRCPGNKRFGFLCASVSLWLMVFLFSGFL